jgi:hypothetical protein
VLTYTFAIQSVIKDLPTLFPKAVEMLKLVQLELVGDKLTIRAGISMKSCKR